MNLAVPIILGLTFLGSALASLPALAVEWGKRTTPEVVFSAEISKPVVALTIDDGPSSATLEILEVLREHESRATFFLIGTHLEADMELSERILEEGHELGHHMMEDRPTRSLPPETFEARFTAMDELLAGLGGSRVFRPGSGWYNDEMVEFAAGRGYRTVLGSVYPFDTHLPWTGFSSWYVLETVTPGAIVVLHDGPERGLRTADVLRAILPELRRQGYRVVPVSELLSLEEMEEMEEEEEGSEEESGDAVRG
jgi:peptidoglycan-N-acetylglucosamine deacetylase